MAGQIILRGKDTWLLRVYRGRDGEGKRQYVNKTLHGTRKQAQTELTKLLHQRDTGELVEPSRATLKEYLARWMEVAGKPRLRPATVANHEFRIERYIVPTLGARRLSHLTALDVQALYTHLLAPVDEGGMALGARSVRIVHNILNPALKQAVRWKLLARNPAADVDLPKQQRKEMHALSAKEAIRFLAAARAFPADPDVIREKGCDPHAGKPDKYLALWCVLVGSGLRPSEALALTWADLEGDTLRVRRKLTWKKGGGWSLDDVKTPRSRRPVPLPAFAVEALGEHRRAQAQHRWGRLKNEKPWRDHNLMFAAENGEPLNARNLDQRHLKPLLKAAGLPRIRLYDLRHTTASLMLESGEHPKVVSERLGHASVALTLDVYSHCVEGMQEEATRRLDSLLAGTRSA